MYRYYLFFYQDFYPHGGMEDCVLKTNSFDDLNQFIQNYDDDYFRGTIAYYDVAEDKYVTADIEFYEDEYHFDRWRFLGWEEEEDD